MMEKIAMQAAEIWRFVEPNIIKGALLAIPWTCRRPSQSTTCQQEGQTHQSPSQPAAYTYMSRREVRWGFRGWLSGRKFNVFFTMAIMSTWFQANRYAYIFPRSCIRERQCCSLQSKDHSADGQSSTLLSSLDNIVTERRRSLDFGPQFVEAVLHLCYPAQIYISLQRCVALLSLLWSTSRGYQGPYVYYSAHC